MSYSSKLVEEGLSTMENVSYSNVDPSSAIALVLVKSMPQRSVQWPYVKDISRIFFGLRQKGFRFRGLGLRRIPEGYYSEDVENFVGNLLSMGYATQRSPICLEADGLKLCNKIIDETKGNEPELKQLGEAVEELIATSPH